MLGVKAPPVTRSAGAGAGAPSRATPTSRRACAPCPSGGPAGALTRYETGSSTPSHWPLDVPGFVTRGQVRPGVVDESHPGIDIAVPLGTPVRASGGGSVAAAGYDADYGLFVLLRHPSVMRRCMVICHGWLRPRATKFRQAGHRFVWKLRRSTAPHLHFEIRHDSKTVDPLDLVKEGR